MSHDEVQSLLADYAAGTLSAADAEGVRAHLASGCLECLAGVFAKPVGLPRDLPLAPVPPPPPPPDAPPRRAPRQWMLASAALIAGIGGAALVLGHGDADQERLARPPLRQPVPPVPPPKLGGAHDSADESPTEEPPAVTSRDVYDETPIIHARGDETTTSSTSPPTTTSTSMPPPDEAAAPPDEPRLAAVEPEAGDTSPPAADPTLPSTRTPPSTAESVTIPTIPPGEIERMRLRRLLDASRAELDERTRELEDATDRARAADVKLLEQAKAMAALEAKLAEAKRRADDLDRKQPVWRDGD